MSKNSHLHLYHSRDKKNLRRINIVVTAQTLQHLEEMAAVNGWGEKDLGRVVDKLMRNALAQLHSNHHAKQKGE